MAIRLNMQESSLKKKRGISFFADNRGKNFDLLNIESSGKHIQVESVEQDVKPRKSIGFNIPEPETAVDSALLFKKDQGAGGKTLKSNFGAVREESSALEANLYQPQVVRSKPANQATLQKASTEKDIVSAMVRLNT